MPLTLELGQLSQKSKKDEKLHPCTYFSQCFSLTEQNYDVGNWEILAIQLALEEWRLWLEGANTLFIIWTNHKNLAYLQQAKKLNTRQAYWSLFFARFNSTITYCPVSKKVKLGALSHQFFVIRTRWLRVESPLVLWDDMTWEIESETEQA